MKICWPSPTASRIPHIINNIFVPTFGMVGGRAAQSHCSIAIFIFSRQKSAKQVARLSLAPGLFNINEPVIFGLPIVFNLPLMIPFVLLPAIGIYFAWLCTTLGLIVALRGDDPVDHAANSQRLAGDGGGLARGSGAVGNHRIWCILLPAFPQSCRASGFKKQRTEH